MARTYRRHQGRRRGSRSLRRRRLRVRSRRTGRSLRSRVTRSIRPEVKFTRQSFAFDPTTGEPVTVFSDSYPNSIWGTVDISPGQGVTRQTRVGDRYKRIGYSIDLYFDCLDENVDCCFCMFKWKQTGNPDTIAWPSPIAGSSLTQGNLINPWFPPQKNQWFKTLMWKTWRNVNPAANGASNIRRKHIKKFFRMNDVISTVDAATSYPTNMSDATATGQTSYRGRIYWVCMTNNVVDPDNRLFGVQTMYFTDM